MPDTRQCIEYFVLLNWSAVGLSSRGVVLLPAAMDSKRLRLNIIGDCDDNDADGDDNDSDRNDDGLDRRIA